MIGPLHDGLELFETYGLSLKAYHHSLKFKYPFRLAHGTRTATDLVILHLRHGMGDAFGEASLPPYLGYHREQVIKSLCGLPWSELLQIELDPALALLHGLAAGEPPVRAAADILLHDYHAQMRRSTLHALLNLSAPVGLATTYTIGLCTDSELEEKLAEAASFKTVKLKLGGPDDQQAIASFRKRCTLPFCVDVNQGWHNRDAAASLMEMLIKAGVLFVEQPFPVGMEEDVLWLRERFNVPIIADESVQNKTDYNSLNSVYDGINVKLMKAGGIQPAMDLMHIAKKGGKIVVLGAMAESACAVTAAAHLASLAHVVDLDGPLLSTNDPFSGIRYKDGFIRLPSDTGIGLKIRL